jgi:hypothetical protein
MRQEKTIRESELAELIGMALHLQESGSAPQDHQLSEREVLQIGENIGIPPLVMDHALQAYHDLRRDVFRAALGGYIRDELLRRLRDVKLRDLFLEQQRVRRRILKRGDGVRKLRRELGLLELLNPFSTSAGRQAFELEKQSLRNEQRRIEHVEKRLRERIEEILDTVAPLSVVLRAERIDRLLQDTGASRFTPLGEIVQEARAHLRGMRRSVTDAFGDVPPRAELIRIVLEVLPELYGQQPGDSADD